MLDNIFETVNLGSNTVFLDLQKEEFLFMYDNLDRDSAQNLVDNYFKEKGRDGIPYVREISLDSYTDTVKITVEVNHNRNFKLENYQIPDALNVKRK
jgi:hypothetical protein